MSDANMRDLMVDDVTTGRRPYDSLIPLTKLDTTARNALTAVAGMVIYNTSTNKINIYNGVGWEAVTSA